ncbi:unnamed protein product, partial [Owenia fusiformis]
DNKTESPDKRNNPARVSKASRLSKLSELILRKRSSIKDGGVEVRSRTSKITLREVADRVRRQSMVRRRSRQSREEEVQRLYPVSSNESMHQYVRDGPASVDYTVERHRSLHRWDTRSSNVTIGTTHSAYGSPESLPSWCTRRSGARSRRFGSMSSKSTQSNKSHRGQRSGHASTSDGSDWGEDELDDAESYNFRRKYKAKVHHYYEP